MGQASLKQFRDNEKIKSDAQAKVSQKGVMSQNKRRRIRRAFARSLRGNRQ